MNKETLLNFINDVIIKNGIENNLGSATIKRSIADYKEYLSASGLADEQVLKAISIIEEKSDEYVELAKSFKRAGLPMPTIKIDGKEKQKRKPKSDFRARYSNLESFSCAKEISSCATERPHIIDSCSSGRGASRSSC